LLKTCGLALAVALLVASCGASNEDSGGSKGGGEQASDSSGEEASVGETNAIIWGTGDRGAVLAHGAAYDAASWEDQGRTLAENGVVALVVEETSTSNVRSAINYLKEESGVGSVALIGSSAGSRGVLEAAEASSEEVGQIILLSGMGDVSGLGEQPKLFVASEGEGGLAEEVSRMAEEAPGAENEALLLPGDAHAQAIFQTEEGERLTQTILERLEEYG
ncbi:MAG: alpha/beta hydrolase, partial [Actinomycetota bacterium]|nr:alpha/beta hydrolase [Actinomycetota bacterium]